MLTATVDVCDSYCGASKRDCNRHIPFLSIPPPQDALLHREIEVTCLNSVLEDCSPLRQTIGVIMTWQQNVLCHPSCLVSSCQ